MIGIDTVVVSRLAEAVKDEAFLRRVYTARERAYCDGRARYQDRRDCAIAVVRYRYYEKRIDSRRGTSGRSRGSRKRRGHAVPAHERRARCCRQNNPA